jgi:predicted TIM-barrel fold metal-dependent hydrolase
VWALATGRDYQASGHSGHVPQSTGGRSPIYVDSIVHSPMFLEAVIRTFGERRILLGSDWPFPMGTPSAEHDFGHLDEKLRLRIRKLNAEEAFGARLKTQQGVS